MKKIYKTLLFIFILLMLSVSSGLIGALAANTGSSISHSYWNDIVIGVPETVYMEPQNNYGTANTSVKYYVNNTVSSSGGVSLDREKSKTVGKFYIYSSKISSVTGVSVDGASLGSWGLTKSGNLTYDTEFKLTLSSGISSSQTKTLEWTINCTMTDGTSATFYAYTVAYAPYLSPVFAAGKCKNTRGSNSFGSGLSWVSGIHGISTAGGYYPYNNFLPLLGGPTQGDGETSPDAWFNSGQQCGLPTKGGWYTSKEYGYNYGDETLCVFERSGESYINVDTSRYTNLNQIPNLDGGIYVTDNEGAGTVWGYWGKLNNWGDRIQSGRNWYTRSTTNPSEYNASVDIYSGDRWTNRGRNWAIRNCAMNSSIPSGWVAFRGAFGTDGSGDRCFCILDSYVNFIQVNKSSWRSAVQNAQKWGFQRGWFTNASDFNNWKSYLKSVAEAVGNPTTTSCSTTSLTNQTNTLNKEYNANSTDNSVWRSEVNDLGVVKVLNDSGVFSNGYKIVSISGVSNPTAYASIHAGENLTLTAGSYDNFTYKGNVLSKNQKSVGSTFTNSNVNTGLETVSTSTTLSYKHITQTQITNGEHRRTFYFLGKDVTVTVNPNGGSWNGSTGNSTVTGSYTGTFAPKNPTRSYDANYHYTFDGWEIASGGGSLSGGTYTFGASAGTLRAKWKATAHSYTDTVTASPTCTEAGTTKHTCSCGYNYNTYPGALGHQWGGVTYTWSGTSACTASRTCSRDTSHKETGSASVTSAVTTAATCTDEGLVTYTATFGNSAFVTQTKTAAIAVDPNNHASYGQVLDAATVREPAYLTDGFTGDVKCEGCHAVRAAGASIPSLRSLIDLDDISVEDVTGNGGRIALSPTKEADIGFEIQGFAPAGDHTLYKTKSGAACADSIKLSGSRVYRDSDETKLLYRFTKMDFTQLDSFYALVKVTGTQNHRYDTNEIYTYQKISLVPAKNIVFDDTAEAIAYADAADTSSGYGIWKRIDDDGSVIEDAFDAFGDLTTARNSFADSVMYSLGDAHQVSVSDAFPAKQGPTATFTFTGSGFDVISVTDSDSGVFTVSVYNGDSVSGKPVKTSMIDTYYGYAYEQVYFNPLNGRVVDASNPHGTTLYAARADTPEEKRVYNDFNSVFYTTDEEWAVKDEQDNPKPAYGWILSPGSSRMYQVPAISIDMGSVGTYTVVIQPRFTQAYGHYDENDGVKYYNFTFDGVRIYDPADGNNEALARYAANGEARVSYELIRDVISDADLILVDGVTRLQENELSSYIKGAPKGELYLLPNGTTAFDVDFSGLTDARIGLRAANGSPCSVTIGNGSGSPRTLTVGSATEQYISLRDLLTEGQTSTITITNEGGGILSVSRLMSVSGSSPAVVSAAPVRKVMSVGARTAGVAMRTVRMLNADIAIAEGSVEASADDGAVTITLQTGKDAETVVLRDADGNLIDPDSIAYTVDETGVKHWTIVARESEPGEYTYTLQAEYENGYAGDGAPLTVSVTVTFPVNDVPGTVEEEGTTVPAEDTTSAEGTAEAYKAYIELLLDVIRTLIELFREIFAVIGAF